MNNLAYALSTEYTHIFPEKNTIKILQKLPGVPQEYYEMPQSLEMSKSHEGRYVDETTYWNDYYENELFRYEWNNGYLEVKEMPSLHCAMCLKWFIKVIEEYLSVNPIASLIATDIGFKVHLKNKTAIRRPDLSIILNNNTNQPELKDRSYHGIYDICIEFLSDSKRKYIENDTVVKKHEYCQANIKEYYIIDSNRIHTAFYKLDSHGKFIPIISQDGIIKSTVLSGFQFREEDLYSFPDLKSLIDDPVYQSYIKKDFQEQKKKAEQEKQEKEEAIKQFEQERLLKEKALRENIRLKQLLLDKGIIV
jgi:Uma2 family endonuclease